MDEEGSLDLRHLRRTHFTSGFRETVAARKQEFLQRRFDAHFCIYFQKALDQYSQEAVAFYEKFYSEQK